MVTIDAPDNPKDALEFLSEVSEKSSVVVLKRLCQLAKKKSIESVEEAKEIFALFNSNELIDHDDYIARRKAWKIKKQWIEGVNLLLNSRVFKEMIDPRDTAMETLVFEHSDGQMVVLERYVKIKGEDEYIEDTDDEGEDEGINEQNDNLKKRPGRDSNSQDGNNKKRKVNGKNMKQDVTKRYPHFNENDFIENEKIVILLPNFPVQKS